MKIEEIQPTDLNYICSEEDLEPIKSTIFLSKDAKKNQSQQVYKIRCIPKDSKYKVGERVVCSMNPAINLIKVNDIIYMIIRDYDILGKVIE